MLSFLIYSLRDPIAPLLKWVDSLQLLYRFPVSISAGMALLSAYKQLISTTPAIPFRAAIVILFAVLAVAIVPAFMALSRTVLSA